MTQLLSKNIGRFSETTIDEEVVVMNLDSGEFFSLVETARATWDLIDGTRDESAVAADLAGRYGIDPQRALQDVRHFIADLEAAGLIRRG